MCVLRRLDGSHQVLNSDATAVFLKTGLTTSEGQSVVGVHVSGGAVPVPQHATARACTPLSFLLLCRH